VASGGNVALGALLVAVPAGLVAAICAMLAGLSWLVMLGAYAGAGLLVFVLLTARSALGSPRKRAAQPATGSRRGVGGRTNST
jgi:hypothetical protein